MQSTLYSRIALTGILEKHPVYTGIPTYVDFLPPRYHRFPHAHPAPCRPSTETQYRTQLLSFSDSSLLFQSSSTVLHWRAKQHVSVSNLTMLPCYQEAFGIDRPYFRICLCYSSSQSAQLISAARQGLVATLILFHSKTIKHCAYRSQYMLLGGLNLVISGLTFTAGISAETTYIHCTQDLVFSTSTWYLYSRVYSTCTVHTSRGATYICIRSIIYIYTLNTARTCTLPRSCNIRPFRHQNLPITHAKMITHGSRDATRLDQGCQIIWDLLDGATDTSYDVKLFSIQLCCLFYRSVNQRLITQSRQRPDYWQLMLISGDANTGAQYHMGSVARCRHRAILKLWQIRRNPQKLQSGKKTASQRLHNLASQPRITQHNIYSFP